MKRKIEYLALIAVVAALGIYLAFDRTDRTQYELPRPAALEKNEITRILIDRPDADLELVKTGDGWVIAPQGYPADKNGAQQMLDAVAGFDLTALVSEGENYHPYDLDPEQRLQVTAWAGDQQVRSFYIGKPATSYRHTFVKLPDDPHVYHAADNLRNTFEKQDDELRDKTVLAFDKAEIRAISIEKDGRKRELALAPSSVEVNIDGTDGAEQPPAETLVWFTAEGDKIGRGEVDRLLGAVSGLKCKGFIADKTKDDYKDPVYTLTLSGSRTHTLAIYERSDDNADFPAIASGSDYPFEIRSYKAEEIMKHLMPESDPEKSEE